MRPAASVKTSSGATEAMARPDVLSPSHHGAGFACDDAREQVRIGEVEGRDLARRGAARAHRPLEREPPQLVGERRPRHRHGRLRARRAPRGTPRRCRRSETRSRPAPPPGPARTARAAARASAVRASRIVSARLRSPVTCCRTPIEPASKPPPPTNPHFRDAGRRICPSVREASKAGPAAARPSQSAGRARPQVDAQRLRLVLVVGVPVVRPPPPRPDRGDAVLGARSAARPAPAT